MVQVGRAQWRSQGATTEGIDGNTSRLLALFRGTRLGGSDNTEASGGSSVPKPPNHRHIPLILLVFAQGFL